MRHAWLIVSSGERDYFFDSIPLQFVNVSSMVLVRCFFRQILVTDMRIGTPVYDTDEFMDPTPTEETGLMSDYLTRPKTSIPSRSFMSVGTPYIVTE